MTNSPHSNSRSDYSSSGIRGLFHALIPHPGFYGWRIVLAGFLACMLSSPGQTFLISFYIEPIMNRLGISRISISSVYSIATLSAAFCLPVMGYLTDKLSSRMFFFGVLSGIGVALIGLSGSGAVASVAVAFFFLRLLGQGAIGIGVVKTTTSWFDKLRGRALAMGALGFAFGELLLPGSVHTLIDFVGWSNSLWVIGIAYLVVFAPGIGFIMRARRPSDGNDSLRDARNQDTRRKKKRAGEMRLKKSSPVFWGLLAGVSFHPFVMTALLFHQVALSRAYGWNEAVVPSVLMGYAVLRICSTYLTGFVFERISAMWGISISAGFTILACLSVFVPMPGGAASVLYGGLLGAAAGIGSITNSTLWQERYGVKGLGRLQGSVNAIRNGFTAASPPLSAWLAMTAGSFVWVPVSAGALALIIAAIPVFVWLTESVFQPGSETE